MEAATNQCKDCISFYECAKDCIGLTVRPAKITVAMMEEAGERPACKHLQTGREAR